jgi:hypothetical protein
MTARRLASERVVALLAALTTEALAPSRVGVKSLPGWVVEYGVATTAGATWLWVGGAAWPGGEQMDQAVLDAAPGRYVVDVFDVATGALLSRETAAAPPLVIGLPRRNGPVAVRITAG